jgi:putative spermidine/putrescine transport system ATP-binding protein
MAYIRFGNIHKSFEDNHVLKNVELTIEKGKFVTLLGPSGCGKSTLLRCLAGLETVDSGTILLNGEDITYKPAQNREIGMVFQHYSLFPNMTAEQNIAFGLKIKKMPQDLIKQKAKAIMALVHLTGKEKHYPAQLSGGQQQRVALARAIVTEPKVLLLDEPLSAIDAQLRRLLQIEIRKIQKEFNITTLFVTHDQDEAMIMSDEIHLFNEGQIEQSGTPVQLYTQPKTKFAASFMGHYNVIDTEKFDQTRELSFKSETIAIRPEVIHVSEEQPPQNEGYIQRQGTIEDLVPRSNILRYHISINEAITLKVDVLFRTHALFDIGQKVWLSIEKRNCIELT